MDLELIVLDYLKHHGIGYTRKMYRELHVKQLKNLSLNKFRNFLRQLKTKGKISWAYKDTNRDITYWTLPKE